MVQQVTGFLYCSVLSALRSDWVAIVKVIYPVGRVTFRKLKKLGSAAGGVDKTMKTNLMADQVSGFLYCSVLSALRDD